jgi:hypothetical protein
VLVCVLKVFTVACLHTSKLLLHVRIFIIITLEEDIKILQFESVFNNGGLQVTDSCCNKWFCFLQKSEISLATQQACGLLHSTGHERPTSIAAMINAREV